MTNGANLIDKYSAAWLGGVVALWYMYQTQRANDIAESNMQANQEEAVIINYETKAVVGSMPNFY